MIDINDKKECCGCNACYNICPKNAIAMKMDDEGFYYPYINKKLCINCDLCKKTCPILNHVDTLQNTDEFGIIVQNNDELIRSQSTAGGAFTPIAEYVIKKGGVVFGAIIDEDMNVLHTYVEKKDDIQKLRSSKYVQSDIRKTYREVKYFLELNKEVCFSGTPCQIEGLLRFLNKDYDNLFLVDVVCRAVPSPGIWRKYMDYLIETNGEINSIKFRDKKYGYQYSTMVINFKNGKELRGGIESQLWLRLFFSGMIIRPSCSACRFRSSSRKSDMTIWDCFNVKDFDKTFNENFGATRILIHSPKGKRMFENIKDSFNYSYVDKNLLISDVKEFCDSPKLNRHRDDFYKDYKLMNFESLMDKYFPFTFKTYVKKFARILLSKLKIDGIIKRMIKKK